MTYTSTTTTAMTYTTTTFDETAVLVNPLLIMACVAAVLVNLLKSVMLCKCGSGTRQAESLRI